MDENPLFQPNEAPDSGTPTISLFLALYLLVLAFFIVLVTISTLEEVKSQAVMDSLTSTFSSLLPPSTDLTLFNAKEGDVLAGQVFEEEVTEIFATAIQVARIEVVQPGRQMRVTMPADAVFFPESSEIRESQLPLLDRIVASLSASAPGVHHDMDFLVVVPYAQNGTLPTGRSLPAARAAAFADALHLRGVPPARMSLGLKPGRGKNVILRFFVRTPEEDRLRFDEALEKSGDREASS